MKKSSKKEIKYSQATQELSDILDDLQSERVDVDEVASKVRRAIELITLCKTKIEKTELEVKRVITQFEKELPAGVDEDEDQELSL